MSKFKNNTAIVTGGGKGIGQAIARRFAEEGAKVAIWEADEIAGEETTQEILAKGQEAHYFKCDITDEQSIQNALSGVSRKTRNTRYFDQQCRHCQCGHRHNHIG